MRKALIALALLAAGAAHAEEPKTEGHVVSLTYICGNHYIGLRLIDQVMQRAIVDNVRSEATDIQHKAVSGKPVTTISILKTLASDGHHPKGFEMVFYPNRVTFGDVEFNGFDEVTGAVKTLNKHNVVTCNFVSGG